MVALANNCKPPQVVSNLAALGSKCKWLESNEEFEKLLKVLFSVAESRYIFPGPSGLVSYMITA